MIACFTKYMEYLCPPRSNLPSMLESPLNESVLRFFSESLSLYEFQYGDIALDICKVIDEYHLQESHIKDLWNNGVTCCDGLEIRQDIFLKEDDYEFSMNHLRQLTIFRQIYKSDGKPSPWLCVSDSD